MPGNDQGGIRGQGGAKQPPHFYNKVRRVKRGLREFVSQIFMGTFVLRRLVLSIPVLVGILAVTFSLGHLIPGDPCRALLVEKSTPQVSDAFIVRSGLDKPPPEQFLLYIQHFLHAAPISPLP